MTTHNILPLSLPPWGDPSPRRTGVGLSEKLVELFVECLYILVHRARTEAQEEVSLMTR